GERVLVTRDAAVTCAGRVEMVGVFGVTIRALEEVTPAEVAWEEVLDILDDEIHPALEAVFAREIRDVVNELKLVFVGRARAEEVAPEDKRDRSALLDGGFGVVRVRETRLLVERHLCAEFVEESRRERRVERDRVCVGGHVAVAGMFLHAGRATAFEVAALESLAVVAEAEAIIRADLPVEFGQVDILVETERVVLHERQDALQTGL